VIIAENDKRVRELFKLLEEACKSMPEYHPADTVQTLLRAAEDGTSLIDQTDNITDRAMKAVNDGVAGETKEWRITVTDYYGGRGIDYDLRDKTANEDGGLMLIITHIPDMTRCVNGCSGLAGLRGRTRTVNGRTYYAGKAPMTSLGESGQSSWPRTRMCCKMILAARVQMSLRHF
jgi:hypothetical protein